MLLVGCMFLADRFGLVALIANGYRALAYILLAVFVLPLLTVGVWRLSQHPATILRRSLHRSRSKSDAEAIARALHGHGAAACAAAAAAAPPAGFDARVEQLRKQYRRAGHGDRDRRGRQGRRSHAARACATSRTKQPVDADTIFPTGSTGKAFTIAALAMLVDEGKIKWDDKVIDHMPGFRMYDPWVTREMTVRDLLVHRSGLGLGAGDLMFVPRSTPVAQGDRAPLRYIKPATSFRSGYAYDNMLYMVAGQLIEEVSGQTWEQYVASTSSAPLGMNHSTDSVR